MLERAESVNRRKELPNEGWSSILMARASGSVFFGACCLAAKGRICTCSERRARRAIFSCREPGRATRGPREGGRDTSRASADGATNSKTRWITVDYEYPCYIEPI
eukprot:6086074-Prymnesium_polylepis.1